MIVVRTPLRISFAGGGTDFSGYYQERDGFVVSSSINKYVTVVLSERFDEKLYVNYSKKEIVADASLVQHDLVREALSFAGVQNGVEITMLADIPSEGSGLGSSSSLTVALLHALYTYMGLSTHPCRLAQDAVAIEVTKLVRPIGYQDQYIAAYGGLRGFRFTLGEPVADLEIALTPEERRALSQELLLFFTGVTRQSGAILADQQAKVQQNRALLDLMRQDAGRLYQRLIHREPHDLGAVMNNGWRLKRELADGITNPAIDQLWQAAMEAGATGAKIAGAGGGGFLLAHVPLPAQPQFRAAFGGLAGVRELPFALSRYGSQIVYSDFE